MTQVERLTGISRTLTESYQDKKKQRHPKLLQSRSSIGVYRKPKPARCQDWEPTSPPTQLKGESTPTKEHPGLQKTIPDLLIDRKKPNYAINRKQSLALQDSAVVISRQIHCVKAIFDDIHGPLSTEIEGQHLLVGQLRRGTFYGGSM